jgi:cytochrome c2
MRRVFSFRGAIWRAGTAVLLAMAVAGANACRAAEGGVIPGASVDRGRQSLAGFGCGSCHEIHGVRGAHGKVGPPLNGVASRSIIAGELANTPENMVRWIRDPQAVEPNTAMPNLQVSEATARDMVAYLYTLR